MDWFIGAGTLACVGIGSASADPGDLPLLPADQSVALLHTQVLSPGQAAVDAAFDDALDRGVTGYALSSDWAGLVAADGSIDDSVLIGYLDALDALGLSVYLGITTIDTNTLQLPARWLDPANPGELAPGIGFDSPELIEDFGRVLDAVVPALVERGGFYLSVGNEVDVWLAAHPDQIGPYAAFVRAARDRVHAIAPDLAVGATLTGEIVGRPVIARAIVAECDAVSLTYYPIGPGSFDVREPSVLEADLDALLAIAGTKQVVFQEIGYPSGWATPTNGSSLARQEAFVEGLFPAIADRPRIRFWSYLHLGDWSQQTLDVLTRYYGLDNPGFVEYLGTLGLIWNDGTPKPALEAFLRGVGGCAYDADGDGRVTVDDLYEQAAHPVDVNGDGVVDGDDARCLERYVRRHERADPRRR